MLPLVPRKPAVQVIKKTSTNKLKKRPSALTLHSNSAHSQASSSRPGTPNSQNSDSQTQRQRNKLHKRSGSFKWSSPERAQQNLPPQPSPSPAAKVQTHLTKDEDRDKASGSEVVLHRQTARSKIGPPPSSSHGRRFESADAPGSPKKVPRIRPSRVGPPPRSPPRRVGPLQHDWEIV